MHGPFLGKMRFFPWISGTFSMSDNHPAAKFRFGRRRKKTLVKCATSLLQAAMLCARTADYPVSWFQRASLRTRPETSTDVYPWFPSAMEALARRPVSCCQAVVFGLSTVVTANPGLERKAPSRSSRPRPLAVALDSRSCEAGTVGRLAWWLSSGSPHRGSISTEVVNDAGQDQHRTHDAPQ